MPGQPHTHHQRAISVAPPNLSQELANLLSTMDAVSLAIVVAVLSLGSALVYLFKTDHERRQQQKVNSTNISSNSIQQQQPRKASQRHSSQATSQKQLPKVHSEKKQVPTPPEQPKRGSVISLNGANKQRRSEPEEEAASSNWGPSADELDKSVLLGVFNPPSCQKATQKGQKAVTTNGSTTTKAKRQSNPWLHQGDLLSLNDSSLDSQTSSYSSEQLFNLIAASNLSQEEVELAVETLLNKLESSNSTQHHQSITGSNNNNNWRQPKSDPLNRLKSQLRDSESALSTEIQNHELTRARLLELKGQLQAERSGSNSIREEAGKARKELGVLNLALEQARQELNKQQLLNKQLKEDSSKLLAKLEQENGQLKSLLAQAGAKEQELRQQAEEARQQVQALELSNQSLSEKVDSLETKLRGQEHQLEQMRSSKHKEEYEACAKIQDLESDNLSLDKALKDQAARLKEVVEGNQLLRKSMQELQTINGHQEELLKRLREERLVNEAAMKRTLCEMEQELKELQAKLSASSAHHDELLRKEMSQVERELSEADEREQRLQAQMGELREGLAALLSQKLPESHHQNHADWVHQYLAAVGQLAKTVEELREENSQLAASPVKKYNGRQNGTSTSRPTSPRSPASPANGRVSKAGSHQPQHDAGGGGQDKKLVETKLLEEYVAQLEKDLEQYKGVEEEKATYESQLKELRLQRSKLEAQVKFGLDSLKAEQERVRQLEEQLLNRQPAAASLT